MPLVVKLFDNAGNQIPPDSDLIIAKRSRLDDHGRGRGGRRAAGREVVEGVVWSWSAPFLALQEGFSTGTPAAVKLTSPSRPCGWRRTQGL